MGLFILLFIIRARTDDNVLLIVRFSARCQLHFALKKESSGLFLAKWGVNYVYDLSCRLSLLALETAE